MEPKFVKIEKNELADLIRKSAELWALECGGVDNWEGYNESISQNLDGTVDYYRYVSTHYEEIK